MATTELQRFSTAEKILYIQDLWDEIAPEVSAQPLTAEHRELIEARLLDERVNPQDESPWALVRDRLRTQR